MADYITRDILRHNPPLEVSEDIEVWQPLGKVAQSLVRRLGIPKPTAILIVESAGSRLAAAE